MKKKILKFLFIFLLCFGLIYTKIELVKADSGWDYDYDSGGSDWDSGSSWDYDYDGSSGTYYYGDFDFDYVIVIIFIIISVIIVINSTKNKTNRYQGENNNNTISSYNYQDMDINKITSIIPDFNINEFKQQAFNIYKDIQNSWMNFDTDTIRNLTTDELYNMYSSQLETLKLKGQKNIMNDISLMDIKIIDVQEVDDIITISVYLKVKCYDYVINEKTEEVVRGQDSNKVIIEYKLSFVKSATNTNKIEKCPNCGAPIDIVGSATCPYCDSVLVKDASDYVMSKKTNIGQSVEK